MSKHDVLATGKLVLGIRGVTVGLSAALHDAVRQLITADEVGADGGRQLHDSDLSGQLNHRNGRLDSGTDPYGWYDHDCRLSLAPLPHTCGRPDNRATLLARVFSRLDKWRRCVRYSHSYPHARSSHHPAPEQREPEVETSR